MSKLLILSDIHIDDYRLYNVGDPKFRLNQYIDYAKWVSSIVVSDDIKAIIVSGDLLNKPILKPEIIITAQNFLKILSEHCPVYLTHGQHDIDIRKDLTDVDRNTLLVVLSDVQSKHPIKYLHDQYETIEGLNFYFRGWEPELDMSALDTKPADVFIGHVTLKNTTIGQVERKMKTGDVLKEDGFRIAFVGDIHKHQEVGKVVIPGVGMQTNFNDTPEVGIIKFDTETFDWIRIPTGSGGTWKPLSMTITDRASTGPLDIVREPSKLSEVAIAHDKVVHAFHPLQVVEELVPDNLLAIHTEIAKMVKSSIDLPSLQFKLISIKGTNFLSIDKLKLAFDNIGKIALIVGKIGAGKSTLIRMIEFAIMGDPRPASLVMDGKKSMHVELTLLYNGHVYEIKRGTKGKTGYTEFKIDKVEQSAVNQKELNNRIAEELKFIDFWDVLYRKQETVNFLGGYSLPARISLINKVFGISIIEGLLAEAKQQTSVREKQVKQTEIDIDQKTAVIASLQASLGTMGESDSSQLLRDLQDLTLRSSDLQKQHETLRQHFVTTGSKKETALSQISALSTHIIDCQNKLRELSTSICYTCKQQLNQETAGELTQELEEAIRDSSTKIEQYRPDSEINLVELNEGVNQVAAELNSIQQRVNETQSKIQVSMMVAKTQQELTNHKTDLENLHRALIVQKDQFEQYSGYAKLLSPQGDVYRVLLQKVSDLMQSTDIRVTPLKVLSTGETRPTFEIELNVQGSWRNYDRLSGGQQTLCDLFLQSRIINYLGGAGLSVHDEQFKFLGSEESEQAINNLRELNIGNVFIVSHEETLFNYDTLIKTALIKKVSNYEII